MSSFIRNIDAAIASLVMQAMEIEYKFQEMDKIKNSKSPDDHSMIIMDHQNYSCTDLMMGRMMNNNNTNQVDETTNVKSLSREICRSIIKTYAIHSGIISQQLVDEEQEDKKGELTTTI
jgi:hypothetical protein